VFGQANKQFLWKIMGIRFIASIQQEGKQSLAMVVVQPFKLGGHRHPFRAMTRSWAGFV